MIFSSWLKPGFSEKPGFSQIYLIFVFIFILKKIIMLLIVCDGRVEGVCEITALTHLLLLSLQVHIDNQPITTYAIPMTHPQTHTPHPEYK